jgi:hypothetical protein
MGFNIKDQLLIRIFAFIRIYWKTTYVDTIKKRTGSFNDIKEAGLEVNAEKTKYMLMPHHQNEKQNQYIQIANRFFENVAQFKYLRMIVANQNLIQEEIKQGLISGNVWYHSVESLVLLPVVSKGGSVWVRNLVSGIVQAIKIGGA